MTPRVAHPLGLDSDREVVGGMRRRAARSSWSGGRTGAESGTRLGALGGTSGGTRPTTSPCSSGLVDYLDFLPEGNVVGEVFADTIERGRVGGGVAPGAILQHLLAVFN